MLNVAILMGRLVANPELKHSANDVAVTNFTLAVDRAYIKAGTERQVDFIDVVAWRNTAEFVCKYFQKGQQMAVQGVIQTRVYTDKEGNKRKFFEIIADNVSFADTKKENTSDINISPPPAHQSGNSQNFEEITADDDLPF